MRVNEPPVRPSAPEVLNAEQLSLALSSYEPNAEWHSLAGVLGVSDHAPAYSRALVQQLAGFELRHGRFVHEADGQLDSRTRRYLEIMYPQLRSSEHPCNKPPTERPPRVLNAAAVARAREANDALELSEPWLSALSRELGAEDPGDPGDHLAQHVARFQLGIQIEEPGIRIHGVVDQPTRRALERAYPSLTSADEQGQQGYLPACLLQWQRANPEQLGFMRRVYEVQRTRAAQKRTFVASADNLAVLQDGRTARPAVARDVMQLLSAAREQRPRGKKPGVTPEIIVHLGYRSAPFQLEMWEHHFPARYAATSSARASRSGGEHGEQAAVLLANYFASRTASPGYSLHNRGDAIDFACRTEEGKWIAPTVQATGQWKSSWCYEWLMRRAAEFGFQQNRRINEPWHWEHVGQ